MAFLWNRWHIDWIGLSWSPNDRQVLILRRDGDDIACSARLQLIGICLIRDGWNQIAPPSDRKWLTKRSCSEIPYSVSFPWDENREGEEELCEGILGRVLGHLSKDTQARPSK